jgi:hypothetical protein
MQFALDHARAVSRHDPAQLRHRQVGPMRGQQIVQPQSAARSQRLHDTASMWTLAPSWQATWPRVITPDAVDDMGQDCPKPGTKSRHPIRSRHRRCNRRRYGRPIGYRRGDHKSNPRRAPRFSLARVRAQVFKG